MSHIDSKEKLELTELILLKEVLVIIIGILLTTLIVFNFMVRCNNHNLQPSDMYFLKTHFQFFSSTQISPFCIFRLGIHLRKC
jgi:hypothetical protein